MARRQRGPTPAEVLKKLQDWWGSIVFGVTIVTGAVVGWNSKASAADVEEVKKLLIAQDKKTAALDGKFTAIERLDRDIAQMRTRIETVSDRTVAAAAAPAAVAPATAPAVASAQRLPGTP
jgi:hypothetical protein